MFDVDFQISYLSAVDTHKATVARHTEHLGNRPDPADEIRNGTLPLPNAYLIPTVKISLIDCPSHYLAEEPQDDGAAQPPQNKRVSSASAGA
jgi:hypothetical protein